MTSRGPTNKAELEALRSELSNALHRVEKALGSDVPAEAAASPSAPTELDQDAARKPIRPVRSAILDALDDLQWPTYTRELVHYCRARYGREIPPTRFGTLAGDEMKAFFSRSRPRTVWLSFALTYDRAEPIKRLWTRSDWPLDMRLVAPTSGRVQFLKMTARLCALAKQENAANPEMMRIVAADHARDLPGVQFKRGVFDLEGWRDLALEHLRDLEPRDQDLRREAAARWAPKLSGASLLFGAPQIVETDFGSTLMREGGA